MSNDDSNESREDMAECGACRAIIPIDSSTCPECNVSFSGVAEDDMGECGACNSLVPLDSKSCPQCGIGFVLDDLTSALSGWMKDEGMSVLDIFGEVDSDNDGSLTADEVKGALKGRNLAFLGANELDRFIAQIDLNQDGVISYPELAAAISMPWVAPEEPPVLAVSAPMEKSEKEAEEDTDNPPTPEFTERVLKRVMRTFGITDKEGFLAHAISFDKDGNNFLKEPELTEAAKSWNSESSEEASEMDTKAEEEPEEEAEEEPEEEAEEEPEEEAEEEPEEEAEEEPEEEAEEEPEEDDGGDLPFKDIDSEEDQFDDDGVTEVTSDSGPASWQRMLMRNYENAFPIMYTIFTIFIIGCIANAVIGPVDGEGGPIAYDGEDITRMGPDTGWIEVIDIANGDIYPCDPEIQQSQCKNTLTPLAGENGASSMPKGFYWDGILLITIGVIALIGTFLLQVKIKNLRQQYRKKKAVEDTEPEDSESEENSSDSEIVQSTNDDEDDEDSDVDDDDDGGSDVDDDADGGSDVDEDDDEGGIEIGDRVGVEDDEGEWYGKVIEFDDEEDAVVVKRDDDGEEYLVDWDSLFQDE